MKNLKKLSREELRNVNGGKACAIVVNNGNGTYSTHYGTCASVVSYNVGNEFGELVAIATSGPKYCSTSLGNVALSSNGGVSHCND
ncbi:bacteriocin-like protein [Chryseobacterium sp. MMS23-Vi53]|uniref:bacteriocin-like protein n=1 Tax=Chryseobacterium sp. MMS23-Vi53 TaxID=3386644 RepID=UPI0039ECEB41